MANEETKICKHCQTEIPKKAKICPNCRKKQGLGCLPIGLIVVGVLIVIGMVFGGSGDKDTDSEQPAQAVSEDAGKTNDTANADKKESSKEKKAEKNVVGEGESFEAQGLKVTVDDIDQDYELKDDEYGLYDLEDGYKYIATSYTFTNTGKSDAYVSIYDFDCYADNTKCEQKFISDGGDFINANLSAGREVSFTTFYAVPEDAESIELEYTSNIWTDEKVFVKVK